MYIEYIKSVIDNNRGKKIVYIPHKGESKDSSVRLLVDKNFKFLLIDMPVELYFLQQNITPSHVISFFTTAFFTLKLFFPDSKFNSIFISKDLLLKKQKEIHKHYDFIKSIGIGYI